MKCFPSFTNYFLNKIFATKLSQFQFPSEDKMEPNGLPTSFANSSYVENATLARHLSELSMLSIKKASKHLLPELNETKPEMKWDVVLVSDPLIRAGTILSTSFMADVTFILGADKVEIEAHKFILASASEVFCTMFNGSLPEGNSVCIPVCNPHAFCLMLQYIYMGIVPTKLEAELGLEVYDLARKYMLRSYEDHISLILIDSLTKENAMIILGTFMLYDEPGLEYQCWKYVDTNVAEIIRTDHFKDIDISTLCKLVKRDTLCISELDLFAGILDWGRAEVERRDQIPTIHCIRSAILPCLSHIRFPTMKSTEFANGPGRSGVLEKHEIGEILLYICSTDAIKPACRYPTIQRPFNIEVIDLTQDDETEASDTTSCECCTTNPNCLFCFGRQRLQQNASIRLSSGIGNSVLSTGTGGRGRRRAHGETQRAFTAVASPQPYCRCRIRGSCPGKWCEQSSVSPRPGTVSRSESRATPLALPMMGRLDRDAYLRRDIIDRAIQRRQVTR